MPPTSEQQWLEDVNQHVRRILEERQLTTISHAAATGSDVQRQIARMKARVIARYKLVAVPGRPEELRKPDTDLGVSFGYGCKTVRVRGMVGRHWIGALTADFQIEEGWANELYALLDRHFGFVGGPVVMDPIISVHVERPMPRLDTIRPRPIRDNPQA